MVESHKNEIKRTEEYAVSKIRGNPKYFYNYAKSKQKSKTTIGPFFINGEYIDNPPDKAEALAMQYSSVYSSEPYKDHIIDENLAKPGVRGLDDLLFNVEDVRKAIHDLKCTSAPGPDGVPAILLKNCCDELAPAIFEIWRRSVEEGQIPPKLKIGLVTPIFKGGNKTLPKDYRPVTLTSHVIKIFEKIVCCRITEYLNKITAWNANQHGFRKGRSCVSQLLDHFHKIVDALEANKSVDIIYLDFCKAFDKVDHEVLLEKLINIGISGRALRWIGQFLIGRKQAVVVDGATSSFSDVGSGVPQGSVIGPLLFLIHVSDIDFKLQHSEAASFADDTRLIKSVGTADDCTNFQADLDSIYEWAESNKMTFNTSKFVHIHYPHPRAQVTSNYQTPGGEPIELKDSTKDLGIIMNKDCRFSEHIEEAVKKANRQAAWILRTFSTREPDLLLILFKQLVLPILEYCCQVWSPVTLGEVRKLEAVQRSFTNKVYGMESVCYWTRLRNLNLYSLERRRDRYLILYTFKIIKGIVPNLTIGNLKLRWENVGRRGLLCLIPLLNRGAMARYKTLKDNSFCVRGPRLYNSLPSYIRDKKFSFESFKHRLDEFLCKVPDKPSLVGAGYAQPARFNSIEAQLDVLRRQGTYISA